MPFAEKLGQLRAAKRALEDQIPGAANSGTSSALLTKKASALRQFSLTEDCPLLTAKTYPEANAIRRQMEGKGLARQAWEIIAKIREVDEVARTNPDFQERIREVHPEVCFTAWNRNVPILAPKKSPAGREMRAALVAQHFGPSAFSLVRQRHMRTQVGDDDINDAFAAFWTVERISGGTSQLIPERPSCDSLGLRMEMWY
jgi:predicted RNase H-like nuclease